MPHPFRRGFTLSEMLELKEPQIWQEISQMGTKKKLPPVDYGPLIEHMEETNDVKRFLEAMGVKRALAAFREEEILANLPPERRDKLRRLLQQERPSSKGSEK